MHLANNFKTKSKTAYHIIRRLGYRGGIIVLSHSGKRVEKELCALKVTVTDSFNEHPDFSEGDIDRQLHVCSPLEHVIVSTTNNVLMGQLITLKKLEHIP
ncbi:hypothetical protein PoB_005861800 [Plakobranchus ocellatus]|uniref:Uncharacterized protein n=1 Tax=Plakobranchus ocellatus TaxID=259542 RepID=A0AAV4CLN6_9GAST|nr:hypothetical protein PoB_005861800 [Plakobranchus ocellatus]